MNRFSLSLTPTLPKTPAAPVSATAIFTTLTTFFTHTRLWQRLCLWLLLCAGAFVISACRTDALRATGAPLYFLGRLAITQEADPRNPKSKADSWSAHFELAGSPSHGTLRLYTPVGTTVAEVSWGPGSATVKTSEETQHYASLDELTFAYFQQSIPVAALFDWLQGQPTQQVISGWEVNLQRAASGIINAERNDPAPRIRLRAIVDNQEINTPAG